MLIIETLFWTVLSVLSFPALLCLMYLWIFGGPGVLDGLPDPADIRGEELLKEE